MASPVWEGVGRNHLDGIEETLRYGIGHADEPRSAELDRGTRRENKTPERDSRASEARSQRRDEQEYECEWEYEFEFERECGSKQEPGAKPADPGA
mgnify:CR=1 FL=1